MEADMEFDAEQTPPLPGFRLAKFEVFNWGTSMGRLFVRPQGQTTLLIGENGSGKSTLVDALLTLLVRPQPAITTWRRVRRKMNATSGLIFAVLMIGPSERGDDRKSSTSERSQSLQRFLACFENVAKQRKFTIARYSISTMTTP